MSRELPSRQQLLQRWLKFSAVGATGIAVQLITLALLLRISGIHYLVATVLAVELSVLHNFVWHKKWTWPDRVSGSRRALLLRFNLTNGALSIAGNLFFMWLFVGCAGMDARFANVLTISICGLANFILSDLIVFT